MGVKWFLCRAEAWTFSKSNKNRIMAAEMRFCSTKLTFPTFFLLFFSLLFFLLFLFFFLLPLSFLPYRSNGHGNEIYPNQPKKGMVKPDPTGVQPGGTHISQERECTYRRIKSEAISDIFFFFFQKRGHWVWHCTKLMCLCHHDNQSVAVCSTL